MDCSFSWAKKHVQINFHNALTRVIQFVCTHPRSYKTTSFEKKQSIAQITVLIISFIPVIHSKRISS